MNEKLTPAVVEYLTYSGVRLHITPVNVAANKAILLMATDKIPYPDPKPYQKPMENAVEGMLTPPEDDPEYMRLKREIDSKRNEWVNRSIIDYCVTYPDFTTRQELIDAFAAKREALRKIARFADNETDWDITLYYLVLNGNVIEGRTMISSDFGTVLNMCTQSIELTGGEILNGLRMFRPVLSGNTD